MTNYALITAAGIGKRMNSEVNKIFLLLDEEPVLARTIKVFNDTGAIDKIVLVARQEDKDETAALKKKYQLNKVEKVVLGGEKRQNSVYNGLISMEDAKADDIVVIHNGVNPFIDEKTIIDSIEAAKKYEAAVVGFKARDTVKEVDEKGFVIRTIDRKKLWQVQTPQTIRYGTAIRAFKKAFSEEYIGTDDTSLVERLGKKVKMIECPYENIKITLPNDLEFANKLLKNSRIGFGSDSHRFVKEEDKDKKLTLGGFAVEGEKGFKANSDGDVILHALFNAVAQGLGEKSVSHYADDMCEKGIKDSREYLKVILKIMKERGYSIGNIGIMLEGSRPRILPIEDKIKESLAGILDISEENIGVTATTGEGLSAFGKGLGMQCFCVVSLNKK
ncbi:2-C-methyl-D-erythritol 4-phosphate cytidylyltransferase [Candidatus Woesearchaeota archaeon]|nr:2-C-methyl-D-erythritol 4-phosphate cytidylyltransferase [Candidatus Woesearchaeota archaeon]